MSESLLPSEGADDREAERLSALLDLQLLDTPPERAFDAVVRCAQHSLGVPIALISLIDDRRQWFKAKYGITVAETPREHAFCVHALARDEIMVVPDARLDPRFADNPLVVGPPHIRFYAGMPIFAGTGRRFAIGTLCAVDTKSRELTPDNADCLRALAHLVETLCQTREAAIIAAELAAERERLQHRLERSRKLFRQAERMANIGSWRLTLADRRTEWSEQALAIHDLPSTVQPSFKSALDLYPAASREQVLRALQQAIETRQPFAVETDLITASGELRRVRCRGELEVQGGEPISVIGVFQDISERYRMELALRHAAMVDGLTGLANRAGFNETIDAQIAAARAGRGSLALVLIDLDHFKAVNDRLGHRAGDTLLCEVAARLRDPSLDGSFAARLGGDEFVLIVTAPALLDELPGFLKGLLSDFARPMAFGAERLEISSTIGVCRLDASIIDRSDLLHCADTALYDAKRDRRGSARIRGEHRRIVADQDDVGLMRRIG